MRVLSGLWTLGLVSLLFWFLFSVCVRHDGHLRFFLWLEEEGRDIVDKTKSFLLLGSCLSFVGIIIIIFQVIVLLERESRREAISDFGKYISFTPKKSKRAMCNKNHQCPLTPSGPTVARASVTRPRKRRARRTRRSKRRRCLRRRSRTPTIVTSVSKLRSRSLLLSPLLLLAICIPVSVPQGREQAACHCARQESSGGTESSCLRR